MVRVQFPGPSRSRAPEIEALLLVSVSTARDHREGGQSRHLCWKVDGSIVILTQSYRCQWLVTGNRNDPFGFLHLIHHFLGSTCITEDLPHELADRLPIREGNLGWSCNHVLKIGIPYGDGNIGGCTRRFTFLRYIDQRQARIFYIQVFEEYRHVAFGVDQRNACLIEYDTRVRLRSGENCGSTCSCLIVRSHFPCYMDD